MVILPPFLEGEIKGVGSVVFGRCAFNYVLSTHPPVRCAPRTPSPVGVWVIFDPLFGGGIKGGGVWVEHFQLCVINTPPFATLHGPPLQRGFGLEGEQLVAVVLVLLMPGGNFCRQTIFQVVYHSFKAVEN